MTLDITPPSGIGIGWPLSSHVEMVVFALTTVVGPLQICSLPHSHPPPQSRPLDVVVDHTRRSLIAVEHVQENVVIFLF